ncbi:MAG: HD domain-containing protein [Acidobacteriota bacterium]
MKSPYLNELQPGKAAVATLLAHSKEIRQKKTGEPYLSLLLGDRTGEIDAKMWDNVAEVVDTFNRDDFVKVKGLVHVYNNRPQFTVHKLVRVEESTIDPADFFPASARDPEEMFAELRAIVGSMENLHLRALLDLFLEDEDIARRFRKAPAAKIIHHAHLGGLLEHVLSLATLCRLAVGHYPNIDGDLLLAGAILHDIGKIYELNYDRGFSYSTEGQLLGHIAMALRMIEQKAGRLAGFPPRLRALVEHMVVSHHGQLEFGSPKVPLFPEALLLHYLDDLDSKMDCMRTLIERDRQIEGCWTAHSQPLNRVVLKKLKYLAGVPEPPSEDQSPAAAAPGLFGEKLTAALRPEE